MESTHFTTSSLSPFLRAHALPANRLIILVVSLPSKPAQSTGTDASFKSADLDAMMPDIEKLIVKAAYKCMDTSCYALSFDDLVAEGRLRLAKILHDGAIERTKTRVGFFKFFATALNNHMRSLVQFNRFTEKRTGVKPPPKNEQFTPESQHRVKTVEVRLDDDDVFVQVADKPCIDEERHAMNELIEDYAVEHAPQVRAVFNQLLEPEPWALIEAEHDARRGTLIGEALHVKIRPAHLAKGIGMPLKQFSAVVTSIRNKVQEKRTMSHTEAAEKERIDCARAKLCALFRIQIPPYVDDIVVRRTLTLAARDQYDKVKDNPDVLALLETAGAKVPKTQAGSLSCFGILYDDTNRICKACGFRKACGVEAANFGLGTITLSPKLLGSNQMRTPVIVSEEESAGVPAPSMLTDEESEIVDYIRESFKRDTRTDGEFYTHQDRGSHRMLFQVITAPAFKLRFCAPSAHLQKQLRYENRAYWAPPEISLGEVTVLIDQHAKESHE